MKTQVQINHYFEESDKTFIFQRMKDRKISLRKVSKLMEVSPSYLSQVFFGKKSLTYQRKIQLEEILKIKFKHNTIVALE